MRIFENPANGYKEEVGDISMLWGILFGWLYFAICGLWAHVLIQMFLGALFVSTAGQGGFVLVLIMWVLYGIATPTLRRNKYLKQGWKEVATTAAAAPFAALRADAQKPGWGETIPLGEAKPAAASAPVARQSVADEIEKLAALHGRGLLTAEEFAAQKHKLLAGPAAR